MNYKETEEKNIYKGDDEKYYYGTADEDIVGPFRSEKKCFAQYLKYCHFLEKGPILKPCPFCGGVPEYFDAGDYNILHLSSCYLYPKSFIFKREVKGWENRK